MVKHNIVPALVLILAISWYLYTPTQIVRADLRELLEIPLNGAPYAYTPFCDSRPEMAGFRCVSSDNIVCVNQEDVTFTTPLTPPPENRVKKKAEEHVQKMTERTKAAWPCRA